MRRAVQNFNHNQIKEEPRQTWEQVKGYVDKINLHFFIFVMFLIMASLHQAALIGNWDAVFDLLQHGADPNSLDNLGFSAIQIAAMNGHRTVVELILDYGADPNPAIHDVAKAGNAPILDALLKHGANVNYKNCCGETPLHRAAAASHFIIVIMLLQHGAKVNVKNNMGKTPLHYAVSTLCFPAVNILLEYGADVMLMRCPRIDMMELLFDHNANTLITSKLPYPRDINQYKTYIRNDAKLIAAGMINEKFRMHPSIKEEMEHYLNLCAEEVNRMKSDKFNNSFVTYYDILVKNTTTLAGYLGNPEILQALQLEEYKRKFPEYAKRIEIKIKKSFLRKQFLDEFSTILCVLFDQLPAVCIDMIARFLSNDDLRGLIHAYK